MFYITIKNYETYNRGECIFNASVCIVQICLDQRLFPLDFISLRVVFACCNHLQVYCLRHAVWKIQTLTKQEKSAKTQYWISTLLMFEHNK